MTTLAPAQPPSDDSAAGTAMVDIRRLEKRFGSAVALHPTDLVVRQGEFFSLLGPSGCGKTTLLRMIGGFEQPTSGDIVIAGESVVHLSPAKRRTNMVFQHLALFPHMSIRENIAFGLEMKRVPAATVRSKVDDALAMVRMESFADRPVEALSGGQKQRIAIARALVNEPAVLLLDEPLSALDLQLRIQMQSELRRIQRSTRSTFIFVTHDQEEAMTMSDRIAVLQAGHIVQMGTPRQIYHRPESRFVAEFIGHSNFLPGTVTGLGVGGEVRLEHRGVSYDAISHRPLSLGDEVSVALRYEAISVLPGTDTRGLPATLELATFAGPTIRLDLRLENDVSIKAETPASNEPPDLSPGARFRVDWAPTTALVVGE
ncbi:ABC transporter ATP-binding protein [Enterovirga rhinocerotis]|uniref:Spermidine/putrescine transport system ATP-binding protein n=1 Tax=Enterovirga rhinocerotis TaxID=1339210 RepID=A0A4R7C363_9HYPH|nr:ABC transporter ATP-binding protein [Enterovirga rhinocerotis]TDR92910.1 spermidine/putrescine transport system ATP-binding protein [Enterovirga rhinocerotis]